MTALQRAIEKDIVAPGFMHQRAAAHLARRIDHRRDAEDLGRGGDTGLRGRHDVVRDLGLDPSTLPPSQLASTTGI